MTETLETISPAALAEKCKLGSVQIIDVRTPMEFHQVHAEGAINLPLDQLDPAKVKPPADGNLYVICQSGSRGSKACTALRLSNVSYRVINVDGGTTAWEAAGLPVVRGQKRMSLERQVRIAAGALVVVGVSLGFFVHPAALGLAAFVGAGLVFAGVTDTCGMGMMLAKMPWNRVSSTACTSK